MQINTIQRLVDMLQLQKNNLETYQTEVGATPADITDVTADLNNLMWIMDFAEIVDTNKKVVTQIKSAVYNGSGGGDIPPFPVYPPDTPPTALIPDCLGRAMARNKRFRAAAGYTIEIGIALGIGGLAPDPPDPSTVKPTIQVTAAQTGYTYSVVVSNRAEADAWTVMSQTKGGDWVNSGTYTGKSADVVFTPIADGDPAQLNVRVQLKRKNANYGLLSDITVITVNP